MFGFSRKKYGNTYKKITKELRNLEKNIMNDKLHCTDIPSYLDIVYIQNSLKLNENDKINYCIELTMKKALDSYQNGNGNANILNISELYGDYLNKEINQIDKSLSSKIYTKINCNDIIKNYIKENESNSNNL